MKGDRSDVRRRRLAALLVGVSLAWTLVACVLDAGMAATPASTTDSRGHAMGFNDPLSPEHFRILAAHFRVGQLCSTEYAYAWLLVAAQLGCLVAVWQEPWRWRWSRAWVFWVQNLIFPLGWLGWLVLPSILRAFASGTVDRETITDIPFVVCVAQSVWVLAATVAGGLLRPPGIAVASPWDRSMVRLIHEEAE